MKQFVPKLLIYLIFWRYDPYLCKAINKKKEVSC